MKISKFWFPVSNISDVILKLLFYSRYKSSSRYLVICPMTNSCTGMLISSFQARVWHYIFRNRARNKFNYNFITYALFMYVHKEETLHVRRWFAALRCITLILLNQITTLIQYIFVLNFLHNFSDIDPVNVHIVTIF